MDKVAKIVFWLCVAGVETAVFAFVWAAFGNKPSEIDLPLAFVATDVLAIVIAFYGKSFQEWFHFWQWFAIISTLGVWIGAAGIVSDTIPIRLSEVIVGEAIVGGFLALATLFARRFLVHVAPIVSSK